MHATSGLRRSPRYEGEDVRPLRQMELWGWYAYGIGAEVFAVCGVGSFLPLTLEQLARERGFLLSDKAKSCAGKSTSGMSRYARAAVDDDKGQCAVYLFGLQMNTASFAMYTFSLAVLVQALSLVSFSAVADHGKNRKALLLGFGFTGAIASMLFILVSPLIYPIASILVVISVTCLGSSFVILNSFLPVLVANDPSVLDVQTEPTQDISLESINSTDYQDSNEHFQSTQPHPTREYRARSKQDSRMSPELQRSTQVSSKGVGLGYAAAVLVQVISIIILLVLSKTSLSTASKTVPPRIILLVVGVWWFSFTVVTRRWLRNRPGPPLQRLKYRNQGTWRSRIAYVVFAWSSLWKTVKTAAKLKQVSIFLGAWFLLSDAVATVSGTAILFAKTELKMRMELIALMSVVATTSGIAGAFAWPRISKRLGLTPQHTIMACIALFELIPLYGLLEYIPFIKNMGVIRLQQPWEIYPLASIHGFVSGGLSSYCRSFYAALIPPGQEAAFYALYAVTDKGSSVIGPAIVGMMVDATGSVRMGFTFLAVLIILPIPLVWLVNVDQGRQDSLRMSELMTKSKVDASEASPPSTEEGEGLLAGSAHDEELHDGWNSP